MSLRFYLSFFLEQGVKIIMNKFDKVQKSHSYKNGELIKSWAQSTTSMV
jgi:GTP-binding protein EngB required for normal cell division